MATTSPRVEVFGLAIPCACTAGPAIDVCPRHWVADRLGADWGFAVVRRYGPGGARTTLPPLDALGLPRVLVPDLETLGDADQLRAMASDAVRVGLVRVSRPDLAADVWDAAVDGDGMPIGMLPAVLGYWLEKVGMKRRTA